MTQQTSSPPRAPRAGAIVMLIIGAVLTVCGPVLGILIGSFALMPTALDYADRTVRLAPAAAIELKAGDSVFLLAPVANLEAAHHEDCTANADGREAAVSYEPASALNTRANGMTYESFGKVTADQHGTYTLSCDTETDVIAAPPFEMGSFFGPLGWWTAAGVLVSIAGIVLAILGIVRLTGSPR